MIEEERPIWTVLERLGVDFEDKSLDLGGTPHRFMKMLDETLATEGVRSVAQLDALIVAFTTFPVDKSSEDYQPMVLEKDIRFYSTCSHHLLPFFGVMHVAYIPDKKIAGLSKLVRVVNHFSKRLQLQERLTNQVADFLVQQLKPVAVMVQVEARHMCMESRGVRSPGTVTKTCAIRGVAKSKAAVRNEFYQLLGDSHTPL